VKQEPKPNSILILGVTSGTTGKQKMPMLTHMNLICGLEGQRFLGFDFNEKDSYLSYVPLTHV
jgi:long-subunit acyl-CoA synthetase (AMP-forming)